ncbi:MAG: transcriptional repressor LexA, partial [Acidobacteria bacterium]|nr:transcriptional repressor LexA [Acidobacteriota bacterium]
WKKGETMKLTKRQKEILDFVAGFIEENGYSPSMEEIAEHFQFASLNAVFKHLEALEIRGYLHRDTNRARSIQLSHEESPGIRALPLFGYVAAGRPIEAVSAPETLEVPNAFLPGRGRYYVLQVQGESMIEEQIRNGDYVVVESRETADPGETVVALIDNEKVTLKKYYPEGGRVRLQPANESLAPIILDEARVKIQGVVVSVMRKYH